MVNYDKIDKNFDGMILTIQEYLSGRSKNRMNTMKCVHRISDLCKDNFREIGYRKEPTFLKPTRLVELARGMSSSEFVEHRNNLFDTVIIICIDTDGDIREIRRKFPKRNNGALINTYSNSNASIELAIVNFYEKIGYTS